ncbi:hypothetical protein N7523_003665 [Penicillium sp. IBT 18751x]|nr:hypothetical protein N7523_003665 [Penicillium sp. IBT 18751x]
MLDTSLLGFPLTLTIFQCLRIPDVPFKTRYSKIIPHCLHPIELQVENFDRLEDANAFMGGENYVSNPIGTDFDVEEWAAYILGKAKPDRSESLTKAEEKALKKRKEIGERKELPSFFF